MTDRLADHDFFFHAPIMCHILDAEGRYVDVNETELRTLGRMREEMIGHKPNEFQAPTDRKGSAERWQKLLRDGHLETELRFLRRDETPVDVALRSVIVRGPAGDIQGAFSVLLDITERQRLMRELAETRAGADRRAGELESLFNSVGEALIILDRQGRPVRMNRAALETSGLDKPHPFTIVDWPSVVGLLDTDGRSIPPEQTPGGRTLLKGEAVRDALMRLRRKSDGREFLISVTSVPIWGSDGTLIGASVAYRDVSEFDRVRREVESLFNTVGEALILLDPNGRPLRMNRTALELAGLDALPGVDMSKWATIIDLMDTEGRPIPPEQTPGGRTLTNGETVREEFMRLRRKTDGREMLIAVTSVPIRGPDGALVGASVAYRDISEFDRVRRELQQTNEDLVRANKFKTEFLANMSHELRTPLNAVIGFAELLRDRAFGPLNEKQAEYVGDIIASSQHLLRLISDILDLTKIEAGRITIQPERIDLAVPFSEALALVKPEADSRHLTLRGQAVPGTIDIYADPVRVRQILLNLLSNAIKFTPDGGQVDLDVEAGDAWATVRVIDTGVGIDPGDFDRIFEPFEQVEPTLTRHHRGAGLGLTISRRLVELHGGSIWVESRRGAGSAFCFRLPRDSATFDRHTAKTPA